MRIAYLEPFGVEVSELDSLAHATDDDVSMIHRAMQSEKGCGVL